MRSTFLALLASLLAASCGRGPTEAEAEAVRCATCGMVVASDSGWRAGTATSMFDSPKCLLRSVLRGGNAADAWVIEYYSQERRPAREMLYVTGSDLESPMGRDLVPVDGRDAAERLRADHGGERVLAWDQIDAELVEALFR